MPIQTNLNVSPYFDDYDENNDFYKILFRPGVAVQVRELNQLQTILQKQIERFGDNIYKRGSIIEGCNFTFHNPLPYVKINDVDNSGVSVNVSSYKGSLVKNSANLTAQIVETSSGYEATAPDLNTLFVRYVNSGNNGNELNFNQNDILTIYDPSKVVEKVDILVKSSGFSNTDTPIFLSAINVTNTVGGFSFVNATGQACTFIVGETITQDITNAKAEIREVNTTIITGQTILKIRPLASELRLGNTSSWQFTEGYNITTSSSKISANLFSSIGRGAVGSIVTDTNGGILSCSILQKGVDYAVEPYVTVAYSVSNTSPSANALIDALDLRAITYKAIVTVNSAFDSIGDGYGLSVSKGTIYQKGYFSRVSDSFFVVEKYSTNTDKYVGFDTTETVIDYTDNLSLLDNVTGSFNQNAPGANRLKLTPKLIALTEQEASANDNFLPIIQFSNGRPFKQNLTTQFKSINEEMARRTAEESGDYVLDQFLVSTQSIADVKYDNQVFEAIIDPGLAYINGYRIQTNDNFYKTISKGIDTFKANTTISINYGNYIKVKELGGLFKFSIGASISLRDTAKTYVTNSSDTSQFSAITAAGNEIGTARIRSLNFVSGSPGEPGAVYYLYLFDVRMNTGKNFKDVRSVYYDGSGAQDGIADIVLDAGNAVIYDPQNSSLVYNAGAKALKNANNISYTYRTINDNVTLGITGTASLSIAQNPGEYFPYSATLTDTEKLSIIAVPLANAICPNAAGSIAVPLDGTNITGTSTAFDTVFNVGDYIWLANSSAAAQIKRITNITNSTYMTVSSAVANGYTTANIALAFPQYMPIPLYARSNRVLTVGSSTTLNLNIGNTISSPVTIAVSYNAQRTVNSIPKTVTRSAFVKIDTATNAANTVGPWCLGVADVIRLRSVYIGNSSAVTTANYNAISNFYIDNNQKKDYYDMSFLYKKPGYSVPASTYMLIEFDVLSTSQNGVKTISSYPINDTITYANSISTINTLEIPEMYHDNGEYYDLRDVFDFRPYSSNTAVITTDDTAATVNPIEPTQANRFDTINDKKFPAPQSQCTATIENYLGRIDGIVLSANGTFKQIVGTASDQPKTPIIPNEGLLLNYLIIPPYPSIPARASIDTQLFLDTNISNIKFTKKRAQDYKVITPIDQSGVDRNQPKRYTMKDIGKLEKRISDLEYYTTLSAAEDNVNKLQLASSVDSATNRFKFGFFVDNFTTINFAEINDPTYNAQIYAYHLQPKKKQLRIGYKFNYKDKTTSECIVGDKVLLKSTRVPLVRQNIATEPSTVEVAVTETIYTTTGTKIDTVTTNVLEVTTTSYNLVTNQVQATGTQTTTNTYGQQGTIRTGTANVTTNVADPTTYTTRTVLSSGTRTNLGTVGGENSAWKGNAFQAAPGSTITGTGGRQGNASVPALQVSTNGGATWSMVDSSGSDGVISYTVPNFTSASAAPSYRFVGYNSNDSHANGAPNTGSMEDWRQDTIVRNATYTPLVVQQVQVANPITYHTETTTVGIRSNAEYTWTTSTSQSIPVTINQYSISSSQSSTTTIQRIPSSTIVYNTTNITKPLFKPNLTGQITIENIFNVADQLQGPFIDLASYIQREIN